MTHGSTVIRSASGLETVLVLEQSATFNENCRDDLPNVYGLIARLNPKN